MNPAGNGVVLDTSLIIDHFRGNPRIHQSLESAAALYIPTIVLGELYYGAFRSAHREKQLEQMRRFLRAAVVVGTDAQTSERYGRIRAELAQAGLPIPENDIWIAAVALQHGWPLATRDQHFKRIADLEVLSW
jgi:tRNA(fMet)-specific endonuclease VapC